MTEQTRFDRAVDEHMNATQTDDGSWQVASSSGSVYTVDLNNGSCTCMDDEHRGEEEVCKHKQYVLAVVGLKRVPVEKAGDDTPALGLGEADHVKVDLEG